MVCTPVPDGGHLRDVKAKDLRNSSLYGGAAYANLHREDQGPILEPERLLGRNEFIRHIGTSQHIILDTGPHWFDEHITGGDDGGYVREMARTIVGRDEYSPPIDHLVAHSEGEWHDGLVKIQNSNSTNQSSII